MSTQWVTAASLSAGLLLGLGLTVAIAPPAVHAQEEDFDFDALFGSDSDSDSDDSVQVPAEDAQAPETDANNDGISDDETGLSAEGDDDAIETDDAGTNEPEELPVVAVPQSLKSVADPEAGQQDAIEEIVVTARKRAESIQEVPLSVTPFTADDLEQRGFTGLDDIAAATPGFTFEPFATGGAHGNAVIRGLAQQFTTSRIQNVSFFLDGVYLQRQSMLDLGLIDMERVEVVKGPQNALYGRNAFAGAVNYITLRPGIEPEGYVSLGLGDNQRREYRASISGPMNAGKTVFGKITAGLTSYDGHTENNHPFANADSPGPNQLGNLGGWDNESYSASLAYEPSERLLVRGSYYRSDAVREASASYSISGVNAARFGLRFDDQNDLNCNETTVPNVGNPSQSHTGFSLWCGPLPDYASDVAERRVDGIVIDPRAVGTIAKTDALTFSVLYDINDAWAVNYLYGYADHNSFTDGGASDEDPLAGRGFNVDATQTAVDSQNEAGYEFANTSSSRPNSILESFSHELRFDWVPAGPLRMSGGLYHSVTEDQEWTALFIMDLCNGDNETNIRNCHRPLSAPNTLAERTVLTAGVAYDQYVRQHGGDFGGGVRGEWSAFRDEINAVFMSGSYDFTDTIEGTLEARYSIEDKSIVRFTDSFGLREGETVTYSQPEDPVIPGLADSVTSAIVVPRDEEQYSYFTPRGIVKWDYMDRGMVYASAAKGVKTGGFNNADDPSELTYDEASNWTYEIGTKNQFFGRLLTFNSALYFVDWTDLQGGVPPSIAGLSTSDIITNIGGASSLGFEFESNLYLPFGFSLDLGGTFNDAKYDDGVIYSAGDQEDGAIKCDGVTCPADGSVGGNQLARTSKVQWSAGLNWGSRMFGGWGMNARLDTNYQSRQFLTPLNKGWVPDRQITNLSFGFTSPDKRWQLNSWVKNLTDEDYAGNSFVIGVFNQYLVGKGARRTFGSTLKYLF